MRRTHALRGRGIWGSMAGTRRIDEIVQLNADRLAAALENHTRTSFMPDARKELRPYTSTEAAELPGIEPARLRKLHSGAAACLARLPGSGHRHRPARQADHHVGLCARNRIPGGRHGL